MKHKRFTISFLIGICFLLYSNVHAELIKLTGDYTTAGDVNGDLIVINGDVSVTGNLSVHGDLKVASGLVYLEGGTLTVNGDLIVTNTSGDATVTVSGDLLVNGAIITKSTSGNAKVVVTENGGALQGGFLSAGRISTDAFFASYIEADHHITVTGSIVTNSRYSALDLPIGNSASVRSKGVGVPYGNIYAGSIFTNGSGGTGYVRADNGYIKVNGPIITRADDDAYVYAESSIEAESIFTRSTCMSAYVSGEKVDVIGDIRTLSYDWFAYVEARKTTLPGQEGTFEDVIAQNIYTKGVYSAYVRAYRSIDVRGDIVAWDVAESLIPCGSECDICFAYVPAAPTEPEGAFVFAGDLDGIAKSFRSPTSNRGYIKAQNIMTISQNDGSVVSNGSIEVSGDIITKGVGSAEGAYIYTYSGDIVAGNISTMGKPFAHVESELGNILVSNVISTTHLPGGGESAYQGYVSAINGDIEAEKIFAYSSGNADVEGGSIDVKGPIDVRSGLTRVDVEAWLGDISAGAISVYGNFGVSVISTYGSIDVREDIRARGPGGSMRIGPTASVVADGDLNARSIKADGQQWTQIISTAGSGQFQLSLREGSFGLGDYLMLYNCEIDLDRDYEFDTQVRFGGTCTLNGKGHHLNFGPNGAIIVASGSSLLLKNIKLGNISGTSLMCLDNTCTLSLHDVELTQDDGTLFAAGNFQIFGDVKVKGPGTEFSYIGDGQLAINKNAKLMFDRNVTFNYRSATEDRISMADSSSRLHFDGSTLVAIEDIRLIDGTLRIDNYVNFQAAPPGAGDLFMCPVVRGVAVNGTIYFGNNNASNNLSLEFGEQAKLSYSGAPIDYQNV